MSILFDILHLTVAALLGLIGLGYERDQEECPPVHLDPAAQVETVEAHPSLSSDVTTVPLVEASECSAKRVTFTYPAL